MTDARPDGVAAASGRQCSARIGEARRRRLLAAPKRAGMRGRRMKTQASVETKQSSQPAARASAPTSGGASLPSVDAGQRELAAGLDGGAARREGVLPGALRSGVEALSGVSMAG